MAKLSTQERAEFSLQGVKARMKKLTPAQRSAIARKAGLAGGRGRKKT
jgi:hypothetical protein